MKRERRWSIFHQPLKQKQHQNDTVPAVLLNVFHRVVSLRFFFCESNGLDICKLCCDPPEGFIPFCENTFVGINTPYDILQQPSSSSTPIISFSTSIFNRDQLNWDAVESVVGHDAIVHLFSTFSVFVKSINGSSFIQLSGQSIRNQLEKNNQEEIHSDQKVHHLLATRVWRKLYQGQPLTDSKVPCADYSQPSRLLYGSKQPSKRAARRMICDIFWSPKPGHSDEVISRTYKRPHIPDDLKCLVPIFTAILKKHQRCSYTAILNSVVGDDDNTTGTKEDDLQSLLAHSTPPYRVVSFLWACFNRVIPRSMTGSIRNRRLLHRRLVEVVGLRKNESVTAAYLLQGMRVSEVPWLNTSYERKETHVPPQRSCTRPRLLFGLWLLHLFRDFFLELIRHFFYCTDAAHTGFTVLYYRHSVWRKLRGLSLAQLSGVLFQPLSTETAKTVLQNRKLSLASIRLLPKQHGVRILMNMSHSFIRPGTLTPAASVNSVLRNLMTVLSYERGRERSFSKENSGEHGNSLLSIDEAYPRLLAFVRRVKARFEGLNTKIYFAKCDVQHCYDTINQQYLLQLIQKLLKDKSYLIRFVDKAFCRAQRGRVFVRSSRSCADSAIQEAPLPSIHPRSSTKALPIYTETGRCFRESGKYLFALLKQHVQESIVKESSKFFFQRQGIAQGSVVSVLLCSIAYDALEKALFRSDFEIDGQNEMLLLHFVDDFLCVSTDLNTVERFVRVMHVGFPEIGCTVNSAKTVVNFPVVLDNGESINESTLVVSDGRHYIPWCGRLLCVEDLSCAFDYRKYWGRDLTEGFATLVGRNCGIALRNALISTIKLRCDALSLDDTINSPQVIATNLYHCFLFGGLNYVAHVVRLPVHNHRFLFFIIKWTVNAAAQRVTRIAESCRFSYSLLPTEVIFLGMCAFVQVLSHFLTCHTRECYGWSVLFAVRQRLESSCSAMPDVQELTEQFSYLWTQQNTQDMLNKIIIKASIRH